MMPRVSRTEMSLFPNLNDCLLSKVINVEEMSNKFSIGYVAETHFITLSIMPVLPLYLVKFI